MAFSYEDTHLYRLPRGGIVGCDLTAICARGRNPVLAHAFLDHLMDVGVAMRNFRWNGYQPPFTSIRIRPDGPRASRTASSRACSSALD